ncbi:MAG TPA: hypothetical protein VFQ61_22705 [Polyangiaceae bacterium]|nr:hypothetical protein [Polyangiaceae bacterium]
MNFRSVLGLGKRISACSRNRELESTNNFVTWLAPKLRICSLLTALALGTCATWLTVAPESIERRLRPHVIQKLRDEARVRFPALDSWSRWVEGAQSASAHYRRRLDSGEPEKLARLLAPVLDSLCELDCGEGAIASTIREGFAESIRSWDLVSARLRSWARGRYSELISQVVADVRVFLWTNAGLLGLAAGILYWRGAGRVAVLFSGVLLVTVAIGAYLYVFGQDWLFTLLFARYLGYGYLGWCALIAVALLDCAFNRGRIVSALLGATTRAIAPT